MLYRLLADALVTLHFLWIVFLIAGGFWGRKHLWVRLIHVPALIFVAMVEGFDWFCPLTYVEDWLRRKGGTAPYPGSFIPHYLQELVYIEADRRTIFLLTLLLCAVNIWLYFGRRR